MCSIAKRMAAIAGGRPGFVTCSLTSDVIDALLGPDLDDARNRATASWRAAHDGRELLGFGTASSLEGPRQSTLGDARRAMAAELRRPLFGDPAPETRPRFFGGARFQSDGALDDARWDGFGGWRFTLPTFLVAVRNGIASGSATLCCRGGETASDLEARLDPDLRDALGSCQTRPSRASAQEGLDKSSYLDAVATATEAIRRGAYEKVVLARRRVEKRKGPIDTGATVGKLAERYPNCFVFKYQVGDRDWIGASPELLVSLADGVARVASLAASRPRGESPEDDRRLADELMSSRKERAEHSFVVTASKEALAPLSTSMTAPKEPSLLRLPNIQHLFTPIRSEVRAGVDILDLVKAMHPTPAVGTWPRGETLHAIERIEGMDRGWYAAPIGWVDLDGQGEFAVGLRSALVQGNNATLYAGAGIVAESDPAAELAETELKFQPLLWALSGG